MCTMTFLLRCCTHLIYMSYLGGKRSKTRAEPSPIATAT